MQYFLNVSTLPHIGVYFIGRQSWYIVTCQFANCPKSYHYIEILPTLADPYITSTLVFLVLYPSTLTHSLILSHTNAHDSPCGRFFWNRKLCRWNLTFRSFFLLLSSFAACSCVKFTVRNVLFSSAATARSQFLVRGETFYRDVYLRSTDIKIISRQSNCRHRNSLYRN